MRPLTAERYEVRLTVSATTRELLRQAQDLLAGAIASNDLDGLFHRALKLLVVDLQRRKAAVTERPRATATSRTPPPAGGSRHVPAAVRRQAWTGADQRCTFVAPDGRRCSARRRLEFHHGPVPFAVGGGATPENIHILCRAHNRYESERFYGPGRRYGGVEVPIETRPDMRRVDDPRHPFQNG